MAFIKCWYCGGNGVKDGKVCPECGGTGGYVIGESTEKIDIVAPSKVDVKIGEKSKDGGE